MTDQKTTEDDDEVVAVGYKLNDPRFEPDFDQGRIMQCKHCKCDVQFSKLTSSRLNRFKKKLTAVCFECFKLHAVPDPTILRPTKTEIKKFRKKYPNRLVDEQAVRSFMAKLKADAETGVEEIAEGPTHKETNIELSKDIDGEDSGDGQ
ncbi:MAG: hypothetical protein GY861_17100 [bacterium]|nr:hypothetical protein [bacterium]